MKKNMHVLLLSILLPGLILLGESCRKDAKDDNPTLITDLNLAESLFTEVKDMADEAWKESSGSGKAGLETGWIILGQCATITLDTTTTPHLLTIDFGSVNCLCADGKNRRGIILITFTGPYRDSGTVITHTFNNYFVNDHGVAGTKTVTNNGKNSSGNLSFSVVENGTITKPNNAGTINWNSNRTREWISGTNTTALLDDIYQISGSANGTTANATAFTMMITKPLQKEIGCKHFVSGTLEITPAGKPVRIIDYGNGTCDNVITVTINNHTFTIYL